MLRHSRLTRATVISVVNAIVVAIRASLKFTGHIQAFVVTIGNPIAVLVGTALKGRQAGLVGALIAIVRHAIPILIG